MHRKQENSFPPSDYEFADEMYADMHKWAKDGSMGVNGDSMHLDRRINDRLKNTEAPFGGVESGVSFRRRFLHGGSKDWW